MLLKTHLYIFFLSSKCQNGIESESTENRCDIEKVELRKKPHHARSSSQTNRFSYMEAVSQNNNAAVHNYIVKDKTQREGGSVVLSPAMID